MKDDFHIERSHRPTDPRKIADHIIREHGPGGFQKLIEFFQRGVDGETIGGIFGVTRQRVCQWRAGLGKRIVTFELDARIQDLVRSREARTTKRTVV